ncbi:MAG: YbjN domain-containing protein [Myxococcales bacterium]|nr:YbjN domain-containing protein [Myxococcales bacterium]
MAPTHTGPEHAGSAVEQSCAVIEKILGLHTAHRESDRGIYIDKGLYVIKQGSSYVMISVAHTGETREQALVRLTAQVVAGVRPEPALLRKLLILNGRLRFGAFSYEPDGDLILFSHSLLGGATLDPNEVMAAVHDVALAADRYDDQIVAQYGGRRMQDVIEESAWARLLKKAGDEATHPHLDEEAAKKAPASGGKKKGS